MQTDVLARPLLIEKDASWLKAREERWINHRKSDWADAAKRNQGAHMPYVRISRKDFYDFDQISLNNAGWYNFIVVDVDGKDALKRIAACASKPDWVTLTPHGAHAGWFVDSVKRDRPKAVRYYNAVKENLRLALNGDSGYVGHGTRNPLSNKTYWSETNTVRKLSQLQAELKDTWTTGVAPSTDGVSGDGRNTRIFLTLTHEKRKNPNANISSMAYMLNAMESWPLDENELNGIIRSVEDFAADRKYAGTPKFPEHMSRLGGQAKTEEKIGASMANLDQALQAKKDKSAHRKEQVNRLRSEGKTIKQVAQELGITTRTVTRLSSRATS